MTDNKQINPFNQNNNRKQLNKLALILIIITLVIYFYSSYSAVVKKQNNIKTQTQISITTRQDFINEINDAYYADIKKIFIDSVNTDNMDEKTKKMFLNAKNMNEKDLKKFIISNIENMDDKVFNDFKITINNALEKSGN